MIFKYQQHKFFIREIDFVTHRIKENNVSVELGQCLGVRRQDQNLLTI